MSSIYTAMGIEGLDIFAKWHMVNKTSIIDIRYATHNWLSADILFVRFQTLYSMVSFPLQQRFQILMYAIYSNFLFLLD